MTAPLTPPGHLVSTTIVTVRTALRLAVVADAQGGHLEPAVQVSLTWADRASSAIGSGSVPVVAGSAAWAVPGSLRRAFDAAHPRIAALVADLSARVEQFLAGLRMGEDLAEVVTIGAALQVVHHELAGADRIRRGWIAGQSRVVRVANWDLSGDDLVTVTGAPPTLAADHALPSEAARSLAHQYGVLVARAQAAPEVGAAARVVVYRRPAAELPDGAVAATDLCWQRDEGLSHLHPVEHPGSGSPLAAGPGVPVQRSGQVGRTTADAPTPLSGAEVRAAIEAARCQLELLQGCDDYTLLSATHARAAELDQLEYEARLVGGVLRRP